MQVNRKAAANVFLEQNLAQEAEEDRDLLYSNDSDDYQFQAELAGDLDKLSLADGSGGGMPMVQAAYAPNAAPMTASQSRGGSYRRAGEKKKALAPQQGLKTSEELQLEKEPIKVREINFFFWKRVIVPPNVYVIHTRMGKTQPITIGLGCSFQMNPTTDTYLVVPAAMQTIGVVANCISKEKQGINVLAYVQWQISDFSIAYRKLDFSDTRDPLGIVNAQLREQAEAAIKDKVATMSVEEVLTDKAPVIEELTTRLKTVAEGRNQDTATGQTGEGLGIKIVTVQIKEALVSSQRLWESLQAPFRHEQTKKARISFLLAQDEIRIKELETRQLAETSQAETAVVIERTKQTKQTEALEARLTEENTRFSKEQEVTRQKLQMEEQTARIRREVEQRQQEEAARLAQELYLAGLKREQDAALEQTRLVTQSEAQRKALETERMLQLLSEESRLAVATLQSEREQLERNTQLEIVQAEFNRLTQEQQDQLEAQRLETTLQRQRLQEQTRLQLEEASNQVRMAQLTRELEITRGQQEVRNMVNERDLTARLVERLPELAAQMPEIGEYTVLQTGGSEGAFDALTNFLSKTLAIAQHLGLELSSKSNGNAAKTAQLPEED